MKQEKQLKQILINSAERASVDFTDVVMKRVNSLLEAQLYDQPLVSPKVKKIFLFTFCAVTIAILVLCLALSLTQLPIINWLQKIQLPRLNYNKIIEFVTTFWIVFVLNVLVQKRFLLARNHR